MPFTGGSGPIPFDFRETLNKFALFLGIVIIVYALLWIFAKLNIIPAIVYGLFPQIILLLIGIFIFYHAWTRRDRY